METPEHAELLRAAAARIKEIGIRKAAREVGLSAMGLRNIVDRRGRPVESSWEKLRAWYMGSLGERALDPAAVAVLLSTLIDQVTPELRARARPRVVESLAQLYGEQGAALPGWLAELAEAVAAHEQGARRREAPFAVVDVLRGTSFALLQPPFDGTPREVVEAIGTTRGAWNGEEFYPPHRIQRIRLGGG
ncbi:MAG TPA: hypothetical protein VGR37_23910 [Longimicrobiaceae bacterium]|nr:hypothetical protein [Longimicrobiaceae bacterium]